MAQDLTVVKETYAYMHMIRHCVILKNLDAFVPVKLLEYSTNSLPNVTIKIKGDLKKNGPITKKKAVFDRICQIRLVS